MKGHRLQIVAAVGIVLFMGTQGGTPAKEAFSSVDVECSYPTPLFDPAAAATAAGTMIHIRVTLFNRSNNPIRLALFGTIRPELVDRGAQIVPFDGGMNKSRVARAHDYPVLGARGAITVELWAVIKLRGNVLSWTGNDGLMGYWPLDPPRAPYQFRVRYHQGQETVHNLLGGAETLTGIWVGDSVSATVELPYSRSN